MGVQRNLCQRCWHEHPGEANPCIEPGAVFMIVYSDDSHSDWMIDKPEPGLIWHLRRNLGLTPVAIIRAWRHWPPNQTKREEPANVRIEPVPPS